MSDSCASMSTTARSKEQRQFFLIWRICRSTDIGKTAQVAKKKKNPGSVKYVE